MPKILQDPVGHSSLMSHQEKFTHVPEAVFSMMDAKNLDLLVGNTGLALQPKCTGGMKCRDCQAGLCCYESKFGEGYVLIGHVQSQESLLSNVSRL